MQKHTPYLDIYIEENRRVILIRQKWKYTWLLSKGITPSWSYLEQKKFHHTIDEMIWNNWGKQFFLKSHSISGGIKKYDDIKWDIDFDVQWVLNNPHWNVYVTKIAKGDFKRSKVRWSKREIFLDTEDLRYTHKGNYNNKKVYQSPILHEYGHAIGFLEDEYTKNSSFYHDKLSLMNIGNELRNRHFAYLLKELNTILPGTNFKIL